MLYSVATKYSKKYLVRVLSNYLLNTEIYKVFSKSTFVHKKVFKVKYLVQKVFSNGNTGAVVVK